MFFMGDNKTLLLHSSHKVSLLGEQLKSQSLFIMAGILSCLNNSRINDLPVPVFPLIIIPLKDGSIAKRMSRSLSV